MKYKEGTHQHPPAHPLQRELREPDSDKKEVILPEIFGDVVKRTSDPAMSRGQEFIASEVGSFRR